MTVDIEPMGPYALLDMARDRLCLHDVAEVIDSLAEDRAMSVGDAVDQIQSIINKAKVD